MDTLFEVLRTSTDNNARKAAAAQLRQLQSEQPEAFLQHTYDGISSPQLKSELRFFLCTLVLSFVDESWHNGVSPSSQERFLSLYVDLVVSQPFPSVLLARKVATIVAIMARRGSRKAQVGAGLPPLAQHVVTRYVAELTGVVQSQAYDRVCRLLLSVHVLLKEMQRSRVGRVFEVVCAAMVAPLSGVFALLPDATAMLAHYDVCLYLLKCSLRTFGRASFDPAFCRFLLSTAWRLAEGLGHHGANPMEAERRLRLLEYALKILEATAVYFPTHLHELGTTFFVAENENTATAGAAGPAVSSSLHTRAPVTAAPAVSPRCLFALLAAVVRSPVEVVVSEKAVCRSLRLFTALLSAEDGDAFIADALHRFITSADFAPFLQYVVAAFFADATTPETLAAWAAQPERAAAELDVDVDDETSPMSCAEQFFVAVTGSSGCAAAALAVAWAVVNHLLQEGDTAAITAALHAIGIGYYTMASEDNTSYLCFLRDRLLPLLQPDALAQASPFIVRRVVWLVGMWCESVRATNDRRAVMAALEAVLQHAVRTQSTLLVLVSLKSMESFVSDNQFATSDLTPTLVATVLQTVQMLLAAVHSATTVKELAGLVHVLSEKGAVQKHGESLVQLFTPPTQSIIQVYEAQTAKTTAESASAGIGSGDDDDGNGDDFLGCLGLLLDCLGSSVRQCRDDQVIWSLFPSVVQPCTDLTCAATPWAEDNAWELLLTMTQSSHAFAAAGAVNALSVVLRHTHRDFGSLPLVFRVLYSLLLLRQDVVEGVVTDTDVDAWVAVVRESPSAELGGAATAVLTAVARMSGGPLRFALLRQAVHALLTSADVQAEQHTMPLALTMALSFASAHDTAEQQQMLSEVYATAQGISVGGTQASHGSPANLSALLEQLVLLLDVSPSALVSRALVHLLQALCALVPHSLAAEDQAMIQRAVESVATTGVFGGSGNSGDGGAPYDVKTGDGDAGVEIRWPQEMLLEWLGDEDVPATSPHISRVMDVFAVLLS